MKRFLQRLFLFEKFQLETTLSKKEIFNKVETFLCVESEDYYGKIWEDGFYVAEKSRKHFMAIGYSRNSFAPVARAKIKESETGNTITVTLRMNVFVMAMMIPMLYLSFLTVFVTETYGLMFIIVLLMLYLGFFRPAKRLKEYLTDMLKV